MSFLPATIRSNLFDEIFDDFEGGLNTLKRMGAQKAPLMRTDIKETDTGYEFDVELPGAKKEDVKAHLADGYLVVSAEMKGESSDGEEGKFIRRERYFGSFSRSFFVGEEITEDDIKAKFSDGVLKICVPKKEPEKAQDERKLITIE